MATNIPVNQHQVNVLPAAPEANAVYYVKNGATCRAYATDGAGVAFEVSPSAAINVVNALNSVSATDPLAAAQGKALKDLIDTNTAAIADRVLKADVINVLTDASVDKPLSAAQGKALNDRINGLNADGHVKTVGWDLATRTITITDEDGTQNAFVIPDQMLTVEASITSTDDTKALAASQGKILSDKIDAVNRWVVAEW
jgi:hypothetical protein